MFGKLILRSCVAAAVLSLAINAGSGGENPADVAAHLDQLLAEEAAPADAQPAARCDDATYLRRVFLDLLGEPPTPDDVLAFLYDEDPQKRSKVVEQLLNDEAYGRNWASYWRDVIMYRRSEERALIATQALMQYLTDQFNNNKPWDQIATEFVTAEGDVREQGTTALILAQNGQPEETVAEISRIFLGIQIQCAQCHDHPTDRWKREQFHQLAAFFPRVAVRPLRNGDQRSFEVFANDSQRMPRNANANARRRGTPEHFMPDLNDPQARGTLMQPVFFATGDSLEEGTLDVKRRGELAKWITSPDNEWFAKALVNRLWSELCGEGFYEPVDDIGPDRRPLAPRTLDYLAEQFTASGHDVKWLLRTITATELYQRGSAPRRDPDAPAFQANVAQPLRAEQLLNCVTFTLGVNENQRPNAGGGMPYAMMRGPRGVFNNVFGFDPSIRRDEITSTIPQAQALMNSAYINAAIRKDRGALAMVLNDYQENDDAITQLYLRTLSRLPTDDEIQTCLAHVRQTEERGEAMEDILWALINSAEFAHRK